MRVHFTKFLVTFFIALGHMGISTAAVSQESQSVQTIWQLLDYVAVDYPAAVDGGQIINEIEYSEMVEFANTARTSLAALSASSEQPELLKQADMLIGAIAAKTTPDEVGKIAHALAEALIVTYPVTLAPSVLPDLTHGKVLYGQECALCHGVAGQGDGPAAQGLEPAPIDFTDRARASKRSIFALYQVISQGLEGTSMSSFATLSTQDRWALAFYIGGFAYLEDDADSAEALWKQDAQYGAAFPDLKSITKVTETELTQRFGAEKAKALLSYLRHNPEIISTSTDGLFAIARLRLSQSQKAYLAGDRKSATNLALSAYLDGFEPVEPALAVRDSILMRSIETNMIKMRNLIHISAPAADVEQQINTVFTLLDTAEETLASRETSKGTSFLAAFTILLREGIEALLIVVAMMAFLHKSDRAQDLRYVHAGWLSALAAGVLTWMAANSVISISGASRELTEGIGALLAAAVLLFVSIWMHSKSKAGAWQNYIKAKMSQALSQRSAWALFLLSFIVVYREVFESILFLIALWSQGNSLAILAGLGAALAVLGAVTWALLNVSKRLPITQFFLFSSALIAVLTVVLTGKGIAALQEAGWFSINPVAWAPRADIIGLYPTWQGITGQALVLITLLIAFLVSQTRQKPAT